MRNRVTAFLSAASLILLASVAGAQAKTLCNDGTTSNSTGRGTCSSHGGVKKSADAKAAKTAATAESKIAKTSEKAEKKVAKTADKAETKVAKTADKASDKVEKSAKKAATVTCTDGSKSKAGRGACSGHGGVKA